MNTNWTPVVNGAIADDAMMVDGVLHVVTELGAMVFEFEDDVTVCRATPAREVPVEAIRNALRVAIQLATVASDWNLDEVEIDAEMMDIYDVKQIFQDALDSLEVGE